MHTCTHTQDYLEMVLQFGYVTLFASAFPLAPAICVVANSIELIADSVKLGCLRRRPRPERSSSIGGWGVCVVPGGANSDMTLSSRKSSVVPSATFRQKKGLCSSAATTAVSALSLSLSRF